MKKINLSKRLLLFAALAVFTAISFVFLDIDVHVSVTRKSMPKSIPKFPSIDSRRSGGGSIANRKGHLVNIPLTKRLSAVSRLDGSVVLGTRTLHIPGVTAPYNASITECPGGYHLVFRYDFLPNFLSFRSFGNIGLVNLDKNFNLKQDFIRVDTGSRFSEDPRIFLDGDECYLVYNDLINTLSDNRAIHLAKLNPYSGEIESNVELNPCLREIEKNWAPFVYTEADGSSRFCFEYQICCPRRILKLQEPDNPSILDISSFEFGKDDFPWDSDLWGTPLGGTPARLVDGEYLAFFHSKFIDENWFVWYIAGAYTFEAHPPFRVTAMSPEPIFFEEMYAAPLLNTAESNKQVLFPAGFAIEKRGKKSLIHLSCGENDSAIKIVTIDKDELMKTLIKTNN